MPPDCEHWWMRCVYEPGIVLEIRCTKCYLTPLEWLDRQIVQQEADWDELTVNKLLYRLLK